MKKENTITLEQMWKLRILEFNLTTELDMGTSPKDVVEIAMSQLDETILFIYDENLAYTINENTMAFKIRYKDHKLVSFDEVPADFVKAIVLMGKGAKRGKSKKRN